MESEEYDAARSMVRTAESLRRTAYHESGHALVAIHTAGAHPIHKATIVPRGHALGMVSQVIPDCHAYFTGPSKARVSSSAFSFIVMVLHSKGMPFFFFCFSYIRV